MELEPNTLWEKIQARTQSALAVKALQPIPTDYQLIEQAGISFLVRIVTNLDRKEQAIKTQKRSAKKVNPFLPYEPDLFVTDISPTHLCLLNKYNVVDHHFLIITRDFEAQESWLNLADFTALCACLNQIDGLAFYNSGQLAGASQPHKHLQLVPLPLIPNGIGIPLQPALDTVEYQEKIGRVPQFSFPHALLPLAFPQETSPNTLAATILNNYHTLITALGLAGSDRPSGAYNLLITRQWMLLIPRFQESFATISVNALGFAGALLVRNSAQLATLEKWGPLTILQQVCQPPSQVES